MLGGSQGLEMSCYKDKNKLKQISCSWCKKKGKSIPPPPLFQSTFSLRQKSLLKTCIDTYTLTYVKYQKTSNCKFFLRPSEMYVNPFKHHQTSCCFYTPRVFLNDPEASSLKCNYKGRLCLQSPVSAGGKEPNCLAASFKLFLVIKT